jgi:fumarylpyruvate hydrolase
LPIRCVVAPAPQPTFPVMGTDKVFPIRRISGVGRNDREHALETGHHPDREPPFFFQKNPDNIVTDGVFPYPPATRDVHFEIELVLALQSGGGSIAPADATARVYATPLVST